MTSKGAPRSLLPKTDPALSSSASPSRDAFSSGGEGPSKRRCVSSACMPCRKRKSKCDGVQPACHACTAVYSSQCYYDIDSDHRRKGALKRDIAQLKDEIGPRNAILDAIRKGSEADVDDIVQLIRSNPDESWATIAESVKKINLSGNEKTAPSSYLEGELTEFSVKATPKSGDIRQYGHTSNLSLLADEEDYSSSAVNQLGTWTTVTSDNEFIKHLLDCYFTWAHPLYMAFSEEVFMHGMQDRKLKYCAPLLVNAILATGCHFSDRIEARADPKDPSTLGDHFFNEADRLLSEDKRPCLTTVQALAIMSIHQAMNNRDSAGWLLMCQTTGMVIELGLHRDQPGQLNGKLTQSEIAARRVTFWGYYFFQSAWAICAGRLSLLPRTAVRMEKPGLIDHLESKPWKPHGHPDFEAEQGKHLEQPGLRYTILFHCSSFCELVDDVVQMFYAPRDRITSRRLQLHHEKFQKWYNALPSALAIKEHGPTLPQIICLHIYYHNAVIQLFRPFIRVSFVQSAKTPKQICVESANKISELMSLYEQTYGSRRIGFMHTHTVMTAVIIHLVTISASNVAPDVFEQTDVYLASAIRYLQEMEKSFPIVSRYLKAIKGLTYKWCTTIPPRVEMAVSDIDISSPSSTFSNLPKGNSVSGRGGSGPSHVIDDRKASAPDILPLGMSRPDANGITPRIHSTTQSQNPAEQQLFWTPFPNDGDGVPLALLPPDRNINQNMDITSLLASGTVGDLPQLNRDGFTMSGDDEVGLWGVNWETGL
ncbi:fungal-specific transcription factor domain-containing protein [Halenospora varia]|nr:fungal-specific transcription factor domain-containing protein [Halenospora varia]